MAIKFIEVSNFKGVKDTIYLDLKPITLLFGPNSAGKSSIVQAIHYAREIFLRRNFDPSQTLTGGSAIDLGKFQTFVHNHDLDNVVKLRLTLDLEGIDLPGAQDIIDEDEIKFNDYEKFEDVTNLPPKRIYDIDLFSYLSKSASVEVFIQFNKNLGYAHAVKLDFLINNELFSTIDLDDKNAKDIYPYYSIINLYNPALKEYLNEDALDNIAPIINSDSPFKAKLMNIHSVLVLENERYLVDGADFVNNYKLHSVEEYDEIFAFFEFVNKVNGSILKLLRTELENFTYIGPLREVPSRNYQPVLPIEKNRWNNGLAAWDMISSGNSDFNLINKWMQNTKLGYKLKFTEHYEVSSENIKEVISKLDLSKTYSNIQASFDNLYDYFINIKEDFDTAQDDEDMQQIFEDFWDESYTNIEQTYEEVLNTFGKIGNDILPEHILKLLPFQYKFKLIDQNNMEVYPIDVGVGVSQVFPIIVAALQQKNSILSIEQPELHIHPAVQVELGDLFIDSINNNPDATFLLETHSEHLILRLLRRIEETTDKKDIEYKLTPDKLNVYWCQSGENGLEVSLLPVDETGEFTKRWPKGFFEERAEELFPDE